MIKENTEGIMKGPEKVDDFLSSLFKALDRQKSKDDRKSVEKKVVVRRLPPTMTEERFLNEVSPLPDYNYMYFIPGDMHAAPFHHSRVYINFIKEDNMYMFTEKFDGYVFVDDTGDEYPAIVELAPYQRIPKKKLDKDPNWGKIHENPVFLEFKRNFEQKTIDTTLKTTQHFFESIEDKSQELDMSTPLLEYLAKQSDKQRVRVNQRDERRKKVFNRKQEKEEIRRNKKGEKEVFLKPKSITKSSPVSKRVIEEKPIKDTSQKKFVKNYKDDSSFVDEKKKYYDESHKMKSEDTSKVDEVKQIELKLKSSKPNNSNKYFDNELKDEIPIRSEKMCADDSKEVVKIKKNDEVRKIEFKLKSTKLSNSNKYFDNDLKDEILTKTEKMSIDDFKEDFKIKKNDEVKKIEFKLKTTKSNNSNKYFDYDLNDDTSLKTEKACVDDSKEDTKLKKKFEILKQENSENETSKSSKHSKSHEDMENVDYFETESIKKHRSDTDKKFVHSKRSELRRESKPDRRIRNKDRPAIEIYRPGMGRLSKLKSDNDCDESESKK